MSKEMGILYRDIRLAIFFLILSLLIRFGTCEVTSLLYLRN